MALFFSFSQVILIDRNRLFDLDRGREVLIVIRRSLRIVQLHHNAITIVPLPEIIPIMLKDTTIDGMIDIDRILIVLLEMIERMIQSISIRIENWD